MSPITTVNAAILLLFAGWLIGARFKIRADSNWPFVFARGKHRIGKLMALMDPPVRVPDRLMDNLKKGLDGPHR